MISISALQKRLDQLEEQRNKKAHVNLIIEEGRTIIYGKPTKIYDPTPTGQIAHNDNSFVRCIMGPYGSGKSTWAINEIVRRAKTVPRWAPGERRRSRWAIVRNTSGELQSTTLKTWLDWFGELGDIKKRQKPIMTYEHVFNDGDGLIELELIFLALDRPEDIRKIKSLELTGCYINELSEVPQAALAHMKGRVTRYPSHAFCKEPFWSGIIADTNPPDEDHWIYKDFEEKQLESYRLFKQPPGLVPDKDGVLVRNINADNAGNLAPDYYEKLAEGQSKEFVNVFCLGKYGTVGFGRLVFSEFNADLHAVDHLEAIQGVPLILGWDFGLTPACVVLQISPRGQLLCLKEYVADGMGIRSFAESVVIPSLRSDFPYCNIGESYGDPAGNARSEIMEEMSCIGELCSLGIPTLPASTNDLDPRLGSIRYFLNKMVDGKPAFLLDKKKCPTLYKGFVKDYVYMRVAVAGEERYKDKPHKNFASHCFVGETLVLTPNGYKEIKNLNIHDYVCTPLGNKRITATMSRLVENLIELEFSDKTKIICTKDHPFYTSNGLVCADELEYTDVLLSIGSEELEKWIKNKNIRQKNLIMLSTIEKPMGIIKRIFRYMASPGICIEMFGSFIMEPFLRNITFITSTGTNVTMTYPTWLVSMQDRITNITQKSDINKTPKKPKSIWTRLGILLLNGINRKKERNFTVKSEDYLGECQKKNIFVFSVIKNLCDHLAQIKKGFVLRHANLNQEDSKGLMTNQENVSSAKQNSNATNTPKSKPVLRVVGKRPFHHREKTRVYDLTVDEAHCFFVNEALVSNCMDALGYGCLQIASDRIATTKSQVKPIDVWNPIARIF